MLTELRKHLLHPVKDIKSAYKSVLVSRSNLVYLLQAFLNGGGTAPPVGVLKALGERWEQGSGEGGVRMQMVGIHHSYTTTSFLSF